MNFWREYIEIYEKAGTISKGNGVWLLTTVSMQYLYKLFLYANGVTPVCFLK